jgi:hypothetical protein
MDTNPQRIPEDYLISMFKQGNNHSLEAACRLLYTLGFDNALISVGQQPTTPPQGN